MRHSRHIAFLLATASGLLLAGCDGGPSALDAAGPQARQIGGLFWLFTGLGAAVYVLVAAFLLRGIFRRRKDRTRDDDPVVHPEPRSEHRLRNAVVASVGATVVILFVLLVSDFLTGRRIYAIPTSDPLTIRVTGRQWWWEVKYEDPVPSRIVTTANEIHVPLGRPVRFELVSNDVIHSFWIPSLNGKKDLVPGHPTTTWFVASEAGTFVGQCAEFCGHQHARMRLVFVAEPEDRFEAWLANQRQPARAPATPSQLRGQEVFLGGPCVMCHRIAGTPAGATVGPDLTHVGSRPMLAAGSIPNKRGHLAAWIADPQQVKPGVRMPPSTFRPQDLHALLDYLQSLE